MQDEEVVESIRKYISKGLTVLLISIGLNIPESEVREIMEEHGIEEYSQASVTINKNGTGEKSVIKKHKVYVSPYDIAKLADIESLVKNFALLGYDNEMIALALNIDPEQFQDLTETEDVIKKAIFEGRHLTHVEAMIALYDALMPGTKTEKFYDYVRDPETGDNVKDPETGEFKKILVREIQKEHKGDIAGLNKYLEKQVPTKFGRETGNMIDLSNCGFLAIEQTEEAQWEEQIAKQQDELRERQDKTRLELYGTTEE